MVFSQISQSFPSLPSNQPPSARTCNTSALFDFSFHDMVSMIVGSVVDSMAVSIHIIENRLLIASSVRSLQE